MKCHKHPKRHWRKTVIRGLLAFVTKPKGVTVARKPPAGSASAKGKPPRQPVKPAPPAPTKGAPAKPVGKGAPAPKPTKPNQPPAGKKPTFPPAKRTPRGK